MKTTALPLAFFTFTIISFSLFSQEINIDSGLVAYYPLDGNAIDVSGNGNDGTVFNALPTDDRNGEVASAMHFDGDNDYINTYKTFDFPERSVSLWLNAEQLGLVSTNTETVPVVISQESEYLEWGRIRVDLGNQMMTLWAGGNNGTYSYSPELHQWYHIVMIRDSFTNYYYINGHLLGTTPADGHGPTHDPNFEFIIGSGRSTSDQFYHGKIDDIRIYNRVINECEIEYLYTGVLPNPDCLLTSTNMIPNMKCHEGIAVFPNPSENGIFNLHRLPNGSGFVEVSDLTGRVIASEITSSTVDLSRFPRGMYYLKFFHKEKGCYDIQKIIIQ